MRLGIDASNIIGRGGLTHLTQILGIADPEKHGFESITIWSSAATLAKLGDKRWLIKRSDIALEQALPLRIAWQRSQLHKQLAREKCDVLFVPGGTCSSPYRPFITMCRNMIPFERHEMVRYSYSWQFLRNWLLRWSMTRTFRRADGLVFLTDFARQKVMQTVGNISGTATTIPHGLDASFFSSPRKQTAISSHSDDRPFRILYVSLIDFYKHQWNVIDAIVQLRKQGYPVCLDLIGPAYAPAMAKMQQTLRAAGRHADFIRYLGPVSYKELPGHYQQSDLFVFASSCENLPNTLLEAMASGLPIACSNYGSMQEVLGDAGLYFDPESADQIKAAVKSFLDSPGLRERMARSAFSRAHEFSWQNCANDTFAFLRSFSSTR